MPNGSKEPITLRQLSVGLGALAALLTAGGVFVTQVVIPQSTAKAVEQFREDLDRRDFATKDQVRVVEVQLGSIDRELQNIRERLRHLERNNHEKK